MAVIQVWSPSKLDAKALKVPVKGLRKKKNTFSSFIPPSQRSYDRSAVGDITDAGSYVGNL